MPPMRQKLDDFGSTSGRRLRVYFPHGAPTKILVTTGSSRPYEGPGPCHCEWHLLDPDTGLREWVPGWYLAAFTR